jgi:hypothetical protein
MSWISDLEYGGPGKTALLFDTLIPWPYPHGAILVWRTALDCLGRSIFKPGRLYRRGLGGEDYDGPDFLDGAGILTPREGTHPGMFTDVRTLEMTQGGCCPPQITEDQIRKERFENIEEDAVLQAMKLRKRGYFGGGG